jgi:hypothetical protein
MTRKHCGWEAVIWHPPANARPQLRLTQSPMPQGVSQPTLVPCLSSHANRCLKTKTPHRSTLPLLPNRSRPKYRTPRMSTDVSRHMHWKQNYGSGTYLHVFVQLVHVCWSVQIIYMYLGFSSPISAISSSVFPAIFQSSLPALLPRFLLTKYNDMDA